LPLLTDSANPAGFQKVSGIQELLALKSQEFLTLKRQSLTNYEYLPDSLQTKTFQTIPLSV
jgi:hypothetical protein